MIGISRRSASDPQLGLLELLHVAGGGTVLLFGVVFWLLDLRGAALVETAYGLATFGTLCWLFISPRSLRKVVWTQAVGVCFVPVGIAAALGGPQASGGFGVWGLIGPLAAMLFLGQRATFVVGGVFLGTLVLAAVIPPFETGPWFPVPSAWLVDTLGVANIAGGSMLALGTLTWFVRRMRFEQDRADHLLMSTLPTELVRALRGQGGQGPSAQWVTLVLADVAELSSLCEGLGAAEIADLLAGLFAHFDSLVSRYRVVRVRTLGDAYLVVLGLPTPDPDHARHGAELALAMRNAVASRRFAGHRIELRIGINSALIPRGSAGRRVFIYDLWGRIASLAARMESRGGPGCILATTDTKELLGSAYRFKPAGLRTSPNSGAIDAWDLLDREERD